MPWDEIINQTRRSFLQASVGIGTIGRVRANNDLADPLTISYGESIEGEITPESPFVPHLDEDIRGQPVEFNGTAGDTITIRIDTLLEESGEFYQANVLEGPEEMLHRGPLGQPGEPGRVQAAVLLNTGTHTIWVHPQTESPEMFGSYRLTLDRHATDRLLDYGDTIEATLDSTDEAFEHLFGFWGTTGDEFTLTMHSDEFEPRLEMYEARSNLIITQEERKGSDNQPADEAEITQQVDTTGVQRFMASSEDFGDGDYTLSLTRPDEKEQIPQLEYIFPREGEEITVGSTVTFGVQEDSIEGDPTYTWEINHGPDTSDDQLLQHENRDNRITTFRPTQQGSYEIEVIAENDGPVGTATFEIKVTHKTVEIGDEEISEIDLLQQYAPILYFHDDEKFYPTRYETLIENSELIERTIELPDTPDTPNTPTAASLQSSDDLDNNQISDNIEENIKEDNPTLLDLQSEELPDHDTRFRGLTTYISPVDDDPDTYESYQDNYPKTVYGSVHTEKVDFRGPVDDSNGSYVAILYLMFYVYDPKPQNDAPSWFEHTGDQEPIVLLLDEETGEPEWVGAQQHFGGELRPWRTVYSTEKHIHVFPALGAHSNFLKPGEFLTQHQYAPNLLAKAPGIDPNSTDILKIPKFHSYRDYSRRNKEVWENDNRLYEEIDDVDDDDVNDYELVKLTGDEIWATYPGYLYTYPDLPTYLNGQVPMQDKKWVGEEELPKRNVDTWKEGGEIGNWMDNEIISYHKQEEAKILSLANIANEAIEIVGEEGTVSLPVANTGPTPLTVSLEITSSRQESDEEYENHLDDIELSAGEIIQTTPDQRVGVELAKAKMGPILAGFVETARHQLSVEHQPSITIFEPEVVPPDASGDWDVEIEIWAYDEDIRVDHDLLQRIESPKLFTVSADRSTINTTVEFVTPPESSGQPGEEITTTAEVQNTGNGNHTFFVGYSAIGPNDEEYNDGGETGQSIELTADESRTVTLSVTIPEEAPGGRYDLVTAVWEESDRTKLSTRLDESWATITVPPQPRIEQVEIESDGNGEVIINVTASNEGTVSLWQTIATSFPDLEDEATIQLVDHDLDEADLLEPGSEVHAEYGAMTTVLEDPLVEGYVTRWSVDDGERHLRTRIATEPDGELRMHIKSIAEASSTFAGDPGEELADKRDQQNEYVYEIAVPLDEGEISMTVEPGPNEASGIIPDMAGEVDVPDWTPAVGGAAGIGLGIGAYLKYLSGGSEFLGGKKGD